MKARLLIISLLTAIACSFTAQANTPLAQLVVDTAAAIKGDASDEGQADCGDTSGAGGAGQQSDANEDESCRLGEDPQTGIDPIASPD